MVDKETKSKHESLFIPLSKIPPVNWIIEGLAIEQGTTVLFGDAGAGKTTLSLQILHAMLAKEKLFCLETKHVNAFVVEQDESWGVFRNHRDRVLTELPLLESLVIPIPPVTWNGNKGNFTYLEELIKAYPAKLVVIDSFTSLGVPDINHPNTSLLLDKLTELNSGINCSFLVLHHVNRQGGILGSVTLQFKVDNLVELDAKGLIFHKTRGILKNVPDRVKTKQGKKPILPIERQGKSILFRLPMSARAKMLVGIPEAKEILACEYSGSTTGSIRATLDKAKKKQTSLL